MKEWTVEATIENVAAVTSLINEQLEALNCPIKAQMQIDVAIDELFSNIALYAYTSKNGNVTVRFETLADLSAVKITFIDGGKPYNPLENEDPDITLPAAERKLGGLGIYIVKKSMDDMMYEYKDGMNVLSILKKIHIV